MDKTVIVYLDGIPIHVRTELVTHAHGTGPNGEAVHSLRLAASPGEGRLYVIDGFSRAIRATPAELFVAAQHALPDYELVALPKRMARLG